MSNQKSFWIDALKAFGIVLVVVGHSGAPGIVEKIIYGFHMPLFFMISGYLFDDVKWLSKGFRSFAKNRWNSYIKLYFIWAAINLVINCPVELLTSGYSIKEMVDSTINHIWWILISYGGSKDFPNCTPLWFLPCLFVASLYLYWIVKLEQRKGFRLTLLVTLLMLLLNYFLQQNENIIFPWHIDVALGASVFMFLGFKIKQWELLSKSITPVILTSFLLLGIMFIIANEKVDMNMNIFGVYPLFYLGALLMSFVLMYFFFNVRRLKYESAIISKLGGGRNTITILALNYFFNTIYSISIGRIMPSFLVWIANVFFVIIVSYLVIFFTEKIKYSTSIK